MHQRAHAPAAALAKQTPWAGPGPPGGSIFSGRDGPHRWGGGTPRPASIVEGDLDNWADSDRDTAAGPTRAARPFWGVPAETTRTGQRDEAWGALSNNNSSNNCHSDNNSETLCRQSGCII